MILGKYTIVIATRPDNPAFPVYRVFIGLRLIGKQFSVPTESDCQWLERQTFEESFVYAQRPCYRLVYSAPRPKAQKFRSAQNAHPKREPEPA